MINTNLTDHFLIAMSGLNDSCFGGTLTYICEHSLENGAMGLVINKPLQASLFSLLQNVNINTENSKLNKVPVYFGGPVNVDHGFVLHRPNGQWESTVSVTTEVELTTSKDILNAFSSSNVSASFSPGDFLVSVGYAGWSAGQLEDEISQNSWLSVKADPKIIFEVSYEYRLKAAMDKIGVSSLSLASGFGHA